VNTLIWLIFLLAGFFAFVIFAIVAVFVVFGAIQLNRNKQELAKVNVFDGLDATELQIISGAILKKKRADQETKVRADAAEALKV
jgi:heme/copper-type cytochrome/quinol oxidase subunit 2